MTDQNVFRPVVRGREGLPRTILPGSSGPYTVDSLVWVFNAF